MKIRHQSDAINLVGVTKCIFEGRVNVNNKKPDACALEEKIKTRVEIFNANHKLILTRTMK